MNSDDELANLLRLNRKLVDDLTQAAESQNDLRQLFTRMHLEISRLIIKHIGLFETPKSLLRVNLHFTNTYLRAANSERVSPEWQEAFDLCKKWDETLSDPAASGSDPFSAANRAMQAQIACTRKMGEVHITEDINSALLATSRDGKCTLSTRDFGNMMELVRNGTNTALQDSLGDIAVAVKKWLIPEYEKAWRNAVFQTVCGEPVPEVEPWFHDQANRS